MCLKCIKYYTIYYIILFLNYKTQYNRVGGCYIYFAFNKSIIIGGRSPVGIADRIALW